MTWAREAIHRLFPRYFTTCMRTDRRQHLIVLGRDNKNVVLCRRDSPTGNVFGEDFLCEWLRSSQLRHRRDVEPLLARRGHSWTQKTKGRAGNRRGDCGENSERQQLKK